MNTSVIPAITRLRSMGRPELAACFDAARLLPGPMLEEGRYRGIVLGLPGIAERATWTLFAKDVVAEDDRTLVGWNVRVRQPSSRDAANLLTSPLLPRSDRDIGPSLFAPFVVATRCGGAVIDYRAMSRGPRSALLARIFDPLVLVEETVDARQVMLGVSCIDLAGRTVRTPTWFALVKEGPVPAEVRARGAKLVSGRP